MEVLARTKNQYPFLYGSTRYREKGEGTPTFSFDTNSETPGNAQRQFLIPWATSPQPGGSYTPWLAVWQAARDFLGYSVLAVNPADNRKYISRWIPLPFPGMVPQSPPPATGNSAVPSLSALRGFMYATSIVRAEGTVPQGNPASLALGALNQVVEGTGGATVAQFNEALLNVGFTSPKFNIMGDAELFVLNQQLNGLGYLPSASGGGNAGFYTESSLMRNVEIDIQPSGKYQVFKGFSALRFTGNAARDKDPPNFVGPPRPFPPGPPLANDVPILLNEGDVMIRWKQVPAEAIPATAIANTIGKTNVYDFGIPAGVVAGTVGCFFRAGTLLCLYPRYRLYRMVNGMFAYDIDFRFKHYPYGANSFFRITSIPTALRNSTGLIPATAIAGGITVITAASGNDMIVETVDPHGLSPGDNVSILSGLKFLAGPFQVTILDDQHFSLNFTEKTPAETITGANAWVLSAGFYPASRDGNPLTGIGSYNLLTQAGDNPIFGGVDYSLLFEPEP